MNMKIIFFTTIVAGLIQGVTGFGSGIVMMMVFPILFTLPQSAGLSSAIGIFLNLSMAYTYRKYINYKKIIPPAIIYIIVCSISIYYSTMFNQHMMKKFFGIFLVFLTIYYLFIQKEDNKKTLSLAVSIFCIIVSAICDGLFGIGGPLMVLYFLSQTHNTHEYLGTIQTFFFINCTYNTCFRIINGILGINHLIIICIGVIGIIIGGLISNKVVDRLDGILIRKLTYIMIGVSGLINFF